MNPTSHSQGGWPTDAPHYEQLILELLAMVEGERDWLVNLANAAALLNIRLTRLNWVGFYLWRDGQLVLGPFQGKPACMRIQRGRGVCGRAAQQGASILVPDVHRFAGHIACDPASASELVVPMGLPNRQLGVLDLDSPLLERFGEADRLGLEAFVRHLTAAIDWPSFIGDPIPADS